MPARIVKAVPKLAPRTIPIFRVSANGGGVVGSAVAGGMPANVIDASGNVTTVSITAAGVAIAAAANGGVVVIVALIDGNGVAIVCPVIVVLDITIWLSGAGAARIWLGSRVVVLAIAISLRGAGVDRVWLDSRLAVLATAVSLSDDTAGCCEVVSAITVLLTEADAGCGNGL